MSDDPTKRLRDDDRLDQILELVRSMDTRLRSLETRVAAIETRIEAIETRLEALERKVDERLYDTRPIWESVQSQLTELRTEVERGFRQLKGQLGVIAGDHVRLEANQRDLESRVGDLESKAS